MTECPPAVIVDVDGTLCNITGLRHYLTDDPRRKNFDAFHGASAFMPANEPVVRLTQTLHSSGITVLVVTARKERWRVVTATWLRKHEVPHEHLMMRPDGDERRDVLVKADILERIRTRYTPVLAIDDNPAIVELWNAEQIPVVTWPGWDYD